MVDPRQSASGFPTAERLLIASGGVLLAAAPYLTWVRVVVLGGIDLPGLLAAANSSTLPAYLLTAIGLGLVLAALLTPSLHAVRITALTAGAVLALAGGTTVYGSIRAVDASQGLAEVGLGTIAAVVGCILLIAPPIVGLVLAARQPSAGPRWHVPAALPLAVAGFVAACCC